MEIEKLKETTRKIFDECVDRLQRTRELHQSFHLLKTGGGVDLIGVSGELTNSKAAKQQLGRMIRERAARGDLLAVVQISDTYFDDTITPENEATRKRLRLNIEEAAALGLCRKREAVMAMVETPMFSMLMQQEYKRTADAIELIGPTRFEEGDIAREANLSGFFPRVQTGSA